MTYDLFYGHPSYSSWSLRAWLVLAHFDLPMREIEVDIYQGGKEQDLAPVAPAQTVPVLRLPDGTVVGDSLAIAETLAERHPDLALWPSEPASRALARWLTCEMHSGFTAIRNACPMVLTHQQELSPITDEVRADLQRLDELWSIARRTATSGPWLFGDYTITDAFFAPVAMRIAGYNLPVAEVSQAYVNAHLADPAIAVWRQKGLAQPLDPAPYARPGPQHPWPDRAPES